MSGGDDGEDAGWRADAARLLDATKEARAASSRVLWRDQIAVRAFAGREERIAAMVDYSCQLTERFLERALDDPGYLTMTAVRRDYLEGPATRADLPVPFNKIMIATFYLTGMDIAHRLISWLDAGGIDWERAMVIFAGQAGRPTAGVTQESNSIAGIVRAVSRGGWPLSACSSRRTPPSFRPTTRPHTRSAAGPGGRLSPAVGRAARHLPACWRHV